MEAITMTKQKQLGTLSLGAKFRYAGYDWVRLPDDGNGGVFALAADVVFDKAFDADNGNDWRASSLREYLNDTDNGFLAELFKSTESTAFREITQDLTTDDGMRNYGTSTDRVTLITCDQYRVLREYIPAVGSWWWTITPWTCNTSNSDSVRSVTASGVLSSMSAYIETNSVRPICNLSSEILVSVDEEVSDSDVFLADFTDIANVEITIKAPDGRECSLEFDNLGELLKFVAQLCAFSATESEDDE
jgi:hypothetical protein